MFTFTSSTQYIQLTNHIDVHLFSNLRCKPPFYLTEWSLVVAEKTKTKLVKQKPPIEQEC